MEMDPVVEDVASLPIREENQDWICSKCGLVNEVDYSLCRRKCGGDRSLALQAPLEDTPLGRAMAGGPVVGHVPAQSHSWDEVRGVTSIALDQVLEAAAHAARLNAGRYCSSHSHHSQGGTPVLAGQNPGEILSSRMSAERSERSERSDRSDQRIVAERPLCMEQFVEGIGPFGMEQFGEGIGPFGPPSPSEVTGIYSITPSAGEIRHMVPNPSGTVHKHPIDDLLEAMPLVLSQTEAAPSERASSRSPRGAPPKALLTSYAQAVE